MHSHSRCFFQAARDALTVCVHQLDLPALADVINVHAAAWQTWISQEPFSPLQFPSIPPPADSVVDHVSIVALVLIQTMQPAHFHAALAQFVERDFGNTPYNSISDILTKALPLLKRHCVFAVSSSVHCASAYHDLLQYSALQDLRMPLVIDINTYDPSKTDKELLSAAKNGVPVLVRIGSFASSKARRLLCALPPLLRNCLVDFRMIVEVSLSDVVNTPKELETVVRQLIEKSYVIYLAPSRPVCVSECMRVLGYSNANTATEHTSLLLRIVAAHNALITSQWRSHCPVNINALRNISDRLRQLLPAQGLIF